MMTELKKLSYKLEDIFTLGKSLPVVSMRQLPKLAEQFVQLKDTPGYIRNTHKAIATHIMTFYEKNKDNMDDEQLLSERFTQACKLNRYGHHLLRLYEA